MLIFAIILAAGLIGADQLVKYWAVDSLKAKGSIDFIKFGKHDIIDLTYVENDGAIFGSMSGQKWFLIGLTSIVLIACVFILAKNYKRSKVLNTALYLFICGGIGNLIDRIFRGTVIDMFDIQLFKFAVFNVADIYVTFAMALILIYIVIIDPKIEKRKKAASKIEANEKNE